MAIAIGLEICTSYIILFFMQNDIYIYIYLFICLGSLLSKAGGANYK